MQHNVLAKHRKGVKIDNLSEFRKPNYCILLLFYPFSWFATLICLSVAISFLGVFDYRLFKISGATSLSF